MIQENVSEKKSLLSFPIDLFWAFVNIFICAYKGVKFIFFDLVIMLFNFVSLRVDRTYKKTKNLVGAEAEKQRERERKKKEQQDKYQEWYNNLGFVKKRNARFEAMRQNLLVDLQNEGSERTQNPRVFQYTARNAEGKVETGTINGYSKLDVNTFLLQENYIVYDIKTRILIDFLYG